MKVKNGFILRQVAGDYIVVSVGEEAVDFNCVVTINESGKFIWDLLEKGVTKEELLQKFIDEFGISEDAAKKDIGEFIQTLLNKGIVEI